MTTSTPLADPVDGTPPSPVPTSSLPARLAALAEHVRVFRWDERFIPTAFATRLLALLEYALKTGTWFVVCAQPGDGKSTALAHFRTSAHAAHVVESPEGLGVTRVPVLATRVSSGIQSADRLMIALASGLGALPNLRAYKLRQWFVDACVRAGVGLIAIDDAHELSGAQLSYLRELTGQLAEQGLRPAVLLLAASASLDPAAQPLWRLISGDALTHAQFRRRLDGTDPLVLVEGLSEPEVGAVLRTLEHRYREQFPGLRLQPLAHSMFGWLTDARLDPLRVRRVRMGYLCDLVHAALADAALAGPEGVENVGRLLHAAAIRLAVRGYAYSVLPARDDASSSCMPAARPGAAPGPGPEG